jgi:hypothetical protein
MPTTTVLAKPTPYIRPVDALLDLLREVIADLSLVRQDRERLGLIEANASTRPLQVSEEELQRLARGEVLTIESHPDKGPVALGAIAARMELTSEHWTLVKHEAAAWRRQRTAITPKPHACHALAETEAALDPLPARVVRLVLAHRCHGMLRTVLKRMEADPGSGFEVAEVLCALLTDPGDRLEALDHFASDAPLFRLGVLDLPGGYSAHDIRRMDVNLSRAFMDSALGLKLDHLTGIEGVEVQRPAVPLEQVILEPTVAAEIAGLDLPAAMAQARDHALGVLLHGPSGTGKTLLAQALATAAQMPLLTVDGRALDQERDSAPTLLSLIRRAAAERAILFLDEVDHLAGTGTDNCRALLTGLESFPVTVIMATNRPLVLDPALERRLLVKLLLGIPGPEERYRILSQELRLAGLRVDGPEDRIRRLAVTWQLSGGWWRNVVQMAAMQAGLDRSGGIVTADVLAMATRRQACSDRTDQGDGAVWHVIDGRPAGELLGEALKSLVAETATALNRLRHDHDLGGLVVIRSPEPAIGSEVADLLAWHMDLPVARIRDVRMSDDDGRPANLDSEHWMVRADGTRRRSVGHLSLRESTVAPWVAPLSRLAGQPAVVVVHLTGPVPASLQAIACQVITNEGLDPTVRDTQWRKLGGAGAAPACRTLAELRLARIRQAMPGVLHAGGVRLP